MKLTTVLGVAALAAAASTMFSTGADAHPTGSRFGSDKECTKVSYDAGFSGISGYIVKDQPPGPINFERCLDANSSAISYFAPREFHSEAERTGTMVTDFDDARSRPQSAALSDWLLSDMSEGGKSISSSLGEGSYGTAQSDYTARPTSMGSPSRSQVSSWVIGRSSSFP